MLALAALSLLVGAAAELDQASRPAPVSPVGVAAAVVGVVVIAALLAVCGESAKPAPRPAQHAPQPPRPRPQQAPTAVEPPARKPLWIM